MVLEFFNAGFGDMEKLLVFTPVKNSIELTVRTIESVVASVTDVPFSYTIYNDRSTDENTAILVQECEKHNIELVNLADITDRPSPNYLLILQMAQRKALEQNAAIVIVESDVVVAPDTLDTLYQTALRVEKSGIVAAVTVDEQMIINYPYEFARKLPKGDVSVHKHLSFCCSLLTPEMLTGFDFNTLNPEKSWYDVTISQQSLRLGLKNILCTTLPVVHRPHSSRPWKLLKYSNPLKYYWNKIFNNRDKI